MTKLEAAIVRAVATRHNVTEAEAAPWVADVLDKGTNSPHFTAVQPAAFDVVQPLWVQLKHLFAAVAPLLTEAETPETSSR